jgi:drug/metabolite transporter (DMT)-like permease
MRAESRQIHYRAVGFIFVAAVLWSLGGLLIKQVDWNPVAIAGMRSAIAALFMVRFVRWSRITWSPIQIGGAVAYAGTVILFVVANKLTTAANTILLQYTAPIYVAMFGAWFLREKTSALDWITTAVVLGGISLFFLDTLTAQGLWGNVCAILSGLCFGWMFLFLRKQKAESPLESVFLGNVLAALVCCPLMFRSMPDGRSWLILLLLGSVQLALPYILIAWAIKRVTAIEAVLITAIEPILNPIWVLLVIGEKPGPWAVLGGAIVLVSVTVRSVLAASRKEPA